MPTLNSIAYTECHDSGKGTISQEGDITRKYDVAWTDLVTFCKALAGGWSDNGAGSNYSYTRPHQDPDWTGFYCYTMEFEGIGESSFTTKSLWTKARITAKYKPFPSIPLIGARPEDIFTEELDIKMQIISTEQNMWQSATEARIPMQVSIQMAIGEYTLSWNNIPSIPGGGLVPIMALAGKVNVGLFRGFGIGKLRFDGAKVSHAYNIYGFTNFQYSLKFSYRDRPWNQLPTKSGGWETITHAADGFNPYQSANFSSLVPS